MIDFEFFTKKRQLSKAALISLFLLVAVLVITTVYFSVSYSAQARLQDSAKNYLTRFTSSLDAALARHSYLPILLAQEPIIQDYLQKSRRLLALSSLIYI